MENPFEIILERLGRIERAIEKLENKASSVDKGLEGEIIDYFK